MKVSFPLAFILLLLVVCCNPSALSDNQPAFSTDSDSTLFYYHLGWQQIMDEGRYGEAEVSYRKALEFDPDFLVGIAVLGRLTTSLEERLVLYDRLEKEGQKITGDEALILEVYTQLVAFTNIREQKPELAVSKIKEVFKLAERNLSEIVQKYPEAVYLKAEYIEFVHAIYGPQAALDTLDKLTIAEQKNNPFLLGYSASMHAELDSFGLALKLAEQLENIQNNSALPKSHAVYADIYFQMDSLKKAKIYADKAASLDPRNLDATRLKEKIDRSLQLKDVSNE